MRILLNGLTQRPGGGMVVLQGLVSGIANACTSDELVVIVYHDTVYSALQQLGLPNVQVIQANKIIDLVDKLVVPLRVRSAALQFKCDVLVTLNFHIPFSPLPQVVYHVDLERFESHPVFPLSLRTCSSQISFSMRLKSTAKSQCRIHQSSTLVLMAMVL